MLQPEMEERVFEGYNGNLVINDAGVVITRGAKGFALQGGMLRGEKMILWEGANPVTARSGAQVVRAA